MMLVRDNGMNDHKRETNMNSKMMGNAEIDARASCSGFIGVQPLEGEKRHPRKRKDDDAINESVDQRDTNGKMTQ